MRRIVTSLLVLLACGLLVCQGCSSGIRGPGADFDAKYEWGTLKAKLDYPISAAHKAAKEAVEALKLKIVYDAHDDVSGQIIARDANRQSIKIMLDALPMSKTALTLTVGFFGDKSKSNVIFNKIVENLRQAG
jgi:hypothetical protein